MARDINLDQPLTRRDMAKILDGYSSTIAEVLTYLTAAIALQTKDPVAVTRAIEELAVDPSLDDAAVKDIVWKIARNLHGYIPKDS